MISHAITHWTSGQRRAESDGRRDVDVTGLPPDTRRLIRNRQYCQILLTGAELPFDELSRSRARAALEQEMALVPGGEVCLIHDLAVSGPYGIELVPRAGDPEIVEPFYLDRDCVTNADFSQFVKAGGYADPQYWPEGVLANVLQFVDETGQAGPKYWSGGQPRRDLLDHPVVGVCWFEANAYAAWAGKRLPSTLQWQRAGTWAQTASSQAGAGQRDPRSGDYVASTGSRFPWGNAFDPHKANTWASGHGTTIPVHACADGSTPNGVRQLIGNVWEWIDTQFQPFAEPGVSVILDESMAEIRGGAYDTYFHSQATCQFRTGQSLLHRAPNIGFRCCINDAALQNDDQPGHRGEGLDLLVPRYQAAEAIEIPSDHELAREAP